MLRRALRYSYRTARRLRGLLGGVIPMKYLWRPYPRCTELPKRLDPWKSQRRIADALNRARVEGYMSADEVCLLKNTHGCKPVGDLSQAGLIGASQYITHHCTKLRVELESSVHRLSRAIYQGYDQPQRFTAGAGRRRLIRLFVKPSRLAFSEVGHHACVHLHRKTYMSPFYEPCYAERQLTPEVCTQP